VDDRLVCRVDLFARLCKEARSTEHKTLHELSFASRAMAYVLYILVWIWQRFWIRDSLVVMTMGVDIKTNEGPFWTALARMMEPASSSDTPITFYQSARPCAPKDLIFPEHRCENLKSVYLVSVSPQRRAILLCISVI
jgi:hypothetical protein